MTPETDPALEELFSFPQQFEFTQAVRILLRHKAFSTPGSAKGRFDWHGEPVRIGVHQSLAFPASDIQDLKLYAAQEPASIDWRDPKPAMLVNFLGLTGPTGVLPHVYTNFLLENAGEAVAAREFFDLFNHRMAMLFYYAWEKYRFAVQYERHEGSDFFRWILLSLAGLASEGMQERQVIPDEFFVRYAALLAMQPRSASALRSILSHYFQVPIEVVQFAGGWFHLRQGDSTRFREDCSQSEKLGYGVVVGREYWSQESVAVLRIGPLNLAAYRSFLPGAPWYRQLAAICRFFAREEIAFDVCLILEREEIPRTQLTTNTRSGEAEPPRAQLGWTTWAKKLGPAPQHAEDVRFRLC